MKFSKRFDTIEPYLFVGISKTIAEKKKLNGNGPVSW